MKVLKLKKDAVDGKNLRNNLILTLENLKEDRDNGNYEHISFKRIGRYLLGKGYFHETQEEYNVIGFEIEYEYKYSFMEEIETTVCFYPVWASAKRHPMAPLEFDQALGRFGEALEFENGFGDSLTVTKELVSQYDIEDFVLSLCDGEPIDFFLNNL